MLVTVAVMEQEIYIILDIETDGPIPGVGDVYATDKSFVWFPPNW